MKIELSELKTGEVISLYSKIIIELKTREIIRSKNLTGDLGEYLVVDYFNKNENLPNLEFAPPSNKSFDAIDKENRKYAVKTITNNVTGVFYGLNPKNSVREDNQIFDYAIIIKLDDNFEMEKIVSLNWNEFLENKKWHSRMKAWNLNLSKKLENKCTILYDKKTIKE